MYFYDQILYHILIFQLTLQDKSNYWSPNLEVLDYSLQVRIVIHQCSSWTALANDREGAQSNYKLTVSCLCNYWQSKTQYSVTSTRQYLALPLLIMLWRTIFMRYCWKWMGWVSPDPISLNSLNNNLDYQPSS